MTMIRRLQLHKRGSGHATSFSMEQHNPHKDNAGDHLSSRKMSTQCFPPVKQKIRVCVHVYFFDVSFESMFVQEKFPFSPSNRQ